MARHTYLRRQSVEDCLAAVDRAVPVPAPLPAEEVAVERAAGRVTARLSCARQSSPGVHVAAMDGLAVRAADLAGASSSRPVRVRIGTGAFPVDTGNALPERTDAVVMAEDVRHLPDGKGDPADAPAGTEVLVAASVVPWRHVRLAGEDIVAGEVLFPRGHRLRPADLGALLAGGVDRLEAVRRPRVALLPTGDELVEPGQPVPAGGVVEFNSRMLAAQVAEWGGTAERRPPAPDDAAALRAALTAALEDGDVVVVIAGSSAGRRDLTPTLIDELGELLVHGVNLMPGKPFAFGVVDGKPVLGLPGYPVSALVAADRFLRAVLTRLSGAALPERAGITARLARKVPSKAGHREVVRVTLGRVGDSTLATPLKRGAGVVTSLARAHGLLTVPDHLEGYDAGAEVAVELLVPRALVDATVVVAGSDDLALSHLDDLLRAHPPFGGLTAQPLGSLGGLLALARGAAHVAGIHLLDPESGAYNLPYIDRHLPGRAVRVVTLAHREQGLAVLPGNPAGIRSVADLGGGAVRLVNRQRGAGTRVLLDHLLAEAGIDPEAVSGYAHEEVTHVAAAMAVRSGAADAAPVIRTAARALGLDFVPLARERFDLAIPAEHLDHPPVARLLEAVGSPAFREVLERLEGYDPAETGDVVVQE